MDDIKLFAKNEKEVETDTKIRINSQDIRMEFGIEKCTENVKWKKTYNARNRTTWGIQ